MRIWSLHPRYLDPQGLVALWRETLLAQKVLAGKTKGYRHHPQLQRFQATRDPIAMIGNYLHFIVEEAETRGYNFDRSKILKTTPRKVKRLKVTRGQIEFESEHLLRKLKKRNLKLFKKWKDEPRFAAHPLFSTITGRLESWEKI